MYKTPKKISDFNKFITYLDEMQNMKNEDVLSRKNSKNLNRQRIEFASAGFHSLTVEDLNPVLKKIEN